jgi:hypothetical protein
MSFFSEASLAMIPSGYKTSKVYSALPTSGDGDLTFSRSNDTATRVGPDGLIEKVRTNLLLQSNSFDTTWVNSNTTETGGQTGYDSTSNAWLLSKSAAGGDINQTGLSVSGLQTFSLYAKAGTSTWISMTILGGLNPRTSFDLVNGVVGTLLGSAVSAKIESVGNGFYRCSIVGNVTSTGVYIYPSEGDGVTSGTTGNILIQDAQLETGDIATDYIATTSAAVSVGPVANLPRLDYLDSSCPRLLLEPQRTNLALYSEQFDNAAWVKEDILSVTANAAVSPDGYTNADLVIPNTTSIDHSIYQNSSTGSAQTFSTFAKAGGYDYIFLGANNGGASNGVFFNLSNGTISQNTSGYSATITSYGNGWYRCTISIASWPFSYAIICTSENGTSFIHAGDGTSGVYLYGAQLEAGAYGTSYIPTLGAAVTRGSDSASKTGISSLIGQTEGTLFADFVWTKVGKTYQSIILGGSSNYNNAVYLLTTESSGAASYQLYIGGTTAIATLNTTFTTGTRYKIAMAYKSGSIAFYVNGISVGTSSATYGAVSEAISQFRYDWPYGGDEQWCSPVNQTLLFPTRLSNDSLASLTSL